MLPNLVQQATTKIGFHFRRLLWQPKRPPSSSLLILFGLSNLGENVAIVRTPGMAFMVQEDLMKPMETSRIAIMKLKRIRTNRILVIAFRSRNGNRITKTEKMLHHQFDFRYVCLRNYECLAVISAFLEVA